MKTVVFALLSTIIFTSCAPKKSDSSPEKPKPTPVSESFQKIKVSDIDNQIELTSKKFEIYFENKLFEHLMLRRQLDTVKLPKQELDTSGALKLLSESQSVLMKIADKAIDLNYMLQEFGQDLANQDKACKDGYLRSFDGKSFTFVVIEGVKDGCTEAMERSKDKIHLINRRIRYLNVEKTQILILSTQIKDSIENDILMPIKVASISGSRPNSIFLAFPSDVEAALQLIRNLNHLFDQLLFKSDLINKKSSIKLEEGESASNLIKTSLETIKNYQNLRPSKSAEKILDTRQKYLNGLLEYLLNSESH
ncbi:MAG: hypothetical protein ACXWRU_16595 [Pseudobdellovibrionaceae bacterium]